MRIIYIHQYFLTPEEGGATRSYYLAKGLVENGVEVEVVTAHNTTYYDLKIIDDIKVHYLPVKYDQRFGFFKRIWAFYRFVIEAKKWIIKLPRPDLLYITSTPLSTGWIGLWAKKKFALPYIFEVRDLWPDAPIQVGAIRNPILKKLLYAFEKKIYRRALKVIALSPGIAESIRTKCPGCELHIVPNFADGDVFTKAGKSLPLLNKYNLQDKLTITYSGAIGQVNAVGELLDLAYLAQKNKFPFQFVVMGKGSKLPDLLDKAKKLKLKNFSYIPFGPKKAVAEVMNISDVAFISFQHLPVLETNSPNKFFDAIASGKVILINHKGWIYDLVERYGIGYHYNPKKPLEVLYYLELLSQDKQVLNRKQQSSRELYDRFFTKEKAINHLLVILDSKKFGGDTKGGAYILTA